MARKNFGDNFSGYFTNTMKKEDALNEDFLKQFKNEEELLSFLQQLQKRGVEAILEGEMDNHLGYEKNERSDSSNARNGHIKKKLRNQYGETDIRVPRDRESSFDPLLVPKRKNITDRVENVTISMYAKGMSVRDIEQQIAEIYDFEISPSAISRITDRVSQDAIAWQNRALESIYCVVWMDGIVFKVRENHRVIDKTIYLVLGLRQDELKEVLGGTVSSPHCDVLLMERLLQIGDGDFSKVKNRSCQCGVCLSFLKSIDKVLNRTRSP